MREVVLVSSVRTPVGRAYKGTLRATRPDELAAVAIKGALDRVPQLDPHEIEDVILGCAMPEAEQGMNVARIASLRAGLPDQISAMTINRFCSSGLQAIAMAAERIQAEGAEVIIAGGTESMTMIPMGGHKVAPNPWLVENHPGAYLSMGLTAERLAERFHITREEADNFSLRSHQKALAAIAAGNFEDETVSVPVSFTAPNGSKPKRTEVIFKTDEGPRADTTLEALAARLGILGQVRFLGALAHQATLTEVAQADIFVLASFAEGLPVALMEAMALGVPCVSTTIAAIPELIDNGGNGLLVSPSNAPALSDALRRLAEDIDLRQKLGRRARATVEEHYNLARNLDLLAATWRRRLGVDR